MESRAPDPVNGEPKTKAFISYSRTDMAFADRLEAALKAHRIEPFIDRTDIYAFEDWWQRIQGLIGAADAVIFVLSPEAASSTICRQEIEFAASLNKRLAPIVRRSVHADTVPESLRRLNFIGFEDDSQFDASLTKLVEALHTDIDWVRKHTELGVQARRWAAADRARGLLLGSVLLEEAERWIVAWPSAAPPPTEETQAFITESRRAARRRRNLMTGSLVAGLVIAIGLAAFAYWQRGVALTQERAAVQQRALAEQQRGIAEQQRKLADEQRGVAVEQRQIAEKNEAQAKQERDRALLTQSRFLADVTNQRVAADDAGTGLLLALDALPDAGSGVDRPYAPEAESALFGARPYIRERAIFWGPGIALLSARFSPDGRSVATALGITAYIWDVQTGRTPVLTGHSGAVTSVAFSPDGSRLITGSTDRTARIWDVATRQTLTVLTGHSGTVWSAGFSPDGRRVVTASADETARIWDAETGKSLTVLAGNSGMKSAEFSPDGRRVVTASRDAQIWDADAGQLLNALIDKGDFGGIQTAAFSPDGQRVVTGSFDRTAHVWDIASGKSITILAGHTDVLHAARYSRDGRRIVTASYDGTARVWDAQSGNIVAVLDGHAAAVWDADLSPDGRQVATASIDRTARIWALELPSSETILRTGMKVVNCEFTSDGRRVVTALENGTVQFWDPGTAQSAGAINVGSISHATLNPDGRTLAVASGNIARILDLQTGKPLVVLTGHSGTVWSIAFSPDGRRVVTASWDKTARVWDVASGSTVTVLNGHAAALDGATFSPDGKQVVTAGADGTARIWNAETGETIRVLEGHGLLNSVPSVTKARFSPDGRWLVTSSYDHTARIWDVETGKTIAVLEGHTEIVWSAAFSPDQRRVVTASRDKTARVWDIATAKTIAVLSGHTADVWAASFSPDGLRVVTGSFDQTARIWRLYPTTQALIEEAKTIVRRCLTRRQRERFFLDAEPPAWCIELKKWPYHTNDWKDWLADKRTGLHPPFPDAPEWQSWRASAEARKGQ